MGSSVFEIFSVALRLGLTSFGGPVAHLGFFRSEYVERRRWLDDAEFADTVALCQFLPGPASSQVGFAIGLRRGGLAGGLAAWLGFTLPSGALMIGFALALDAIADAGAASWVRGMKIAAVAVVAHALWGMARTLCPDKTRVAIAGMATAAMLAAHAAWAQVAVIAAGAVLGLALCRDGGARVAVAGVRRFGAPQTVALIAFAALLVGLPLLHGPIVETFDRFYRAGALVFGGGHVVLPLLESEFVATGQVDRDAFLAGYGAAQAVPGPLFTFAGFLGAAKGSAPTGVAGGLVGLVAVFLPSLLLVYGVVPIWDRVRGMPSAQAALRGANAAVVGLLLAALYDPVWIAGVTGRAEFGIAVGAFLLLAVWRLPAWAIVGLSALAATAVL